MRRGGEVVFVCRVANDTAAVIPAWMFDPGRCAGMAIGMPRASVAALEQMRIILGKLGCDGPATATDAWSQEAADEADTSVAPDPSPDDAVVTAAASAVHQALAPEERADVVVTLARLLLEAARPVPGGDDEAS